MAYNPDKKYSTGIESEYCVLSGYKYDKLNDKIICDIAFFSGQDRTEKKPVEVKQVAIRMLNLNNKQDIIKEIYCELNNISPYKEYFEKDGIK